ncbi:hypothetical protein SEA_OCTOBIEN14_2 [Gordonia phage Octobien14]|uniref:Uncharacterized protein n=1 Tax=Gordonia phage Octobien14 TaxID=2483673 RepID=A0A3G3M9G2_9CAUD|nr:hypothetical protein L3Y22_gp002 [Gordonia phage Octobien14]AYR03150.1 hypothetical protein SEA_OCTOBIEN14_2 [Gordonia phage Octobien14]
MPNTQLAFLHIEKAILTGLWTTQADSEMHTSPSGAKFLVTTVTYREEKTRRKLIVTYEGRTIRDAHWRDLGGDNLLKTMAAHQRKSWLEEVLCIRAGQKSFLR